MYKSRLYVPIPVLSAQIHHVFRWISFVKYRLGVAWTKQNYLAAYGKEKGLVLLGKSNRKPLSFHVFPIKYTGFQQMFPLNSSGIFKVTFAFACIPWIVIYIYIHVNIPFYIIWMNYNDITVASLEPWLARGSIPKSFEIFSYFQVSELLQFSQICKSHSCPAVFCSNIPR